MAQETYAITWEEVHRDARNLAALLRGERFTHVIGIAKGGVIPAIIVARELGIKRVEVINVHSYGDGTLEDEQQRGEVVIGPYLHDICEGYPLLIDDLVDSSATMKAVMNELVLQGASPMHAALYMKGSHSYFPHVRWFSSGLWLLMPWDMSPQFQPPLYPPKQIESEQGVARQINEG
jgi:xanthine phosphoribosyltransferase